MDAELIDADLLLTPAEVAAILYVDPKTVTRWAKAGKLNSFRTPGGHRRFLKSDIHTLITDSKHGFGRVAEPFSDYASGLEPQARHPGRPVESGDATHTVVERTKTAAAAGVVAEAVRRARQAAADEAAQAVTEIADAVAAAASRTALAAETAREARAVAAGLAAHVVASAAARTALATRRRADDAAIGLAQAAAEAAAIVAEAIPPGTERESASAARRLAATVKATAIATADEAASAAARVADAVVLAAAEVALTVSAAATAAEREVASAAATLQTAATATAREVAAATDERATHVAAVAREAAVAATDLQDSGHHQAVVPLQPATALPLVAAAGRREPSRHEQ